ncbi:DUF502 domain-containing protein [Caldimonas sp.]|uniref:DUF502 domain-containing protein n=1 Tax=Caldimonas sp. TaxID=2838790 RepID=UPI00391D75DB
MNPLIKRWTQYFVRGLLAILPLALTVYVLYVFLAWTDSMARWLTYPLFGNTYIPGLGLALAVVAIGGLGFVISLPAVRSLASLIEFPFTNLPVVKSIYTSLKSFADYFAPQHKQAAQQVVVVRFPGGGLEIIGLVTRNSLDGLPEGVSKDDRVAVYLPMGYMIGGYTVFVPRTWITPIAMTVEEAMRSALIAWMARTGQPPVPAPPPR